MIALPRGGGHRRPLLDREGLIWTLVVAHGTRPEQYERVGLSGLEAAADLVMDEDAELGRALSVLKGVEWASGGHPWEDWQDSTCPRCGATRARGHLDDCTLAQALARVQV